MYHQPTDLDPDLYILGCRSLHRIHSKVVATRPEAATAFDAWHRDFADVWPDKADARRVFKRWRREAAR